jgi:hypothetical protein
LELALAKLVIILWGSYSIEVVYKLFGFRQVSVIAEVR